MNKIGCNHLKYITTEWKKLEALFKRLRRHALPAAHPLKSWIIFILVLVIAWQFLVS